MNIKKLAAGLCAIAFALGADMKAESQENAQPPADAQVSAVINGTYLAYIRVNDSLDKNADMGLRALALTLLERTNIEPDGVKGLDIEKDDLTFYPFIYWPVPAGAPTLSEAAQKKVQRYIDRGGPILFDVKNDQDWRVMLGAVKLKPLWPMAADHTLTRAFYLTAGLPGTRANAPILIEAPEARNKESVTTVIIGQGDWANAWAGVSLAADSRERELALRAGVNIVMLAQTGNYKADQVHIPSILERLEPQPQP